MSPTHLYDWFTRSLHRDPNAIALDMGEHPTSYAELDRRADQIARAVIAATATPPRRIALAAPRCEAAYAGWLAIQRLGAATIPLNPDHPSSRLLEIIHQAQVDLTLVTAATDPFRASPRRFRPSTLLIKDGPDPVPAMPPGPPLPKPASDPDSTAFIIFTSGTQGRPKGVPVTQRNISAYLDTSIAQFDVGCGSRLSQFFALTFDASVADMFLAWGSGATLVPPQPGELLDPVSYARRGRLTHWFSVPSAVTVAEELGLLEAGALPDVHHSLFGAEPVTLKVMSRWRDLAPNTTIWNVYGPTEAAITCIGQRFVGPAASWEVADNGTLPIGRPSPGMEAIVIDAAGYPTTDGELCLRGAQRFPTYLDAKENRGQFVVYGPGGRAEEVVGEVTPAHWYRTGDRVSMLGENMVHRGRLDQQVKVRGHRVEIGEVEAALNRYPNVREAAVVMVDARLIAFVAGPDECSYVLEWLGEQLPSYMVPNAIHGVPRLPLNDNGKIDRNRLKQVAKEA